MIDHIISAIQREQKGKRYRNYIADVLRLIGENVAGLTRGMYISTKWSDLEEPHKQDERSGDDIAADIIKRAGLRATKGGE